MSSEKHTANDATRQLIDDLVDKAVARRIEGRVEQAVADERRRSRRTGLRRLGAALAVVLMAGTGMWASTALAAGANCANGLICFSAGDPAVADDINQNFGTLKGWVEAKVGDVDAVANGSVAQMPDAVIGTITTTDVGGTPGAVTGGVAISEGTSARMRIDSNEIDTGADLFLNWNGKGLVRTGGDLQVSGTLATDTVSSAELGPISGGVAFQSNSQSLRIDGNEIESDTPLYLNYNGKQKVIVNGDLQVSGALTGTHANTAATCRWTPNTQTVGADNQMHEISCDTGEYMAGWRCYATASLDGSCALKCCTP